jgi:hypothetical protein
VPRDVAGFCVLKDGGLIMAAQSLKAVPRISVRLIKARQNIATAFGQCLSATRTSHAVAARSMAVTKRTVGAWVRGTGPISLERVFASRRLAHSFREILCVHDHGLAGLPYIARKRVRRRRA